jgi:RNA polymerase sigma-70 factor (ECF subfamily)
MARLTEAFVAAWRGPPGDLPEGFDGTLAASHAKASAAWTEFVVGDEAFVAYLAERMPDDAPPANALARMHVEDLYLACACSTGTAAALDAFDRRCMASIDVFLRQISGGEALCDEVTQLVRSRLLVAEGNEPRRIGQYVGRGSLVSWVGIAAQRAALSLLRSDRSRQQAHAEAMADAMALGGDPELDYLKVRYRQDFRAAFGDAVGLLSPRERVILRLHLIDGLSHEEIARMYKVNQSTMTRWIARARETIAKETNRLVCERLHLDTSEYESLAVLVESQLDLSLARLLRVDG